jgi:hypothetical protein
MGRRPLLSSWNTPPSSQTDARLPVSIAFLRLVNPKTNAWPVNVKLSPSPESVIGLAAYGACLLRLLGPTHRWQLQLADEDVLEA